MGTFVVVNGIGDTAVAFRGALLAELVRRGHRVVLSTPRPLERPVAEVEAEVRALGAECEFSPIDRTGLSPRRELETRAHFDALFARLRPDGVLATNPKPVFHAIPAACAAGVPRRAAMITGLGHAFIDVGLRARVLRFIATRLYRRAMRDATDVLFQNPDDRREFERRGLLRTGREGGRAGDFRKELGKDSEKDPGKDPERGLRVRSVAGSGVDLEAFPERPLPESGPGVGPDVGAGGGPVFLMVARLLGDKGVREFAAAAREVRARDPRCRFRLVGWIDANPSAIRRSELDAWISDGTLEYAGRLDDVRGELAAASVFVLPSYREGLPKSALEALATGRAIVTTDAPGCRETVVDGVNGLLVPPRDAHALARACLALAADRGRLVVMGRASRALAERAFDVRQVNATLVAALGA